MGLKRYHIGHAPNEDSQFLVGELANIDIRHRIRFVQPSSERVGKLVKFAELPLSERSISSTPNIRRVLMVFLGIMVQFGVLRQCWKYSYLEITEERVHKEVEYNERREDSIEYAHKDETPSKSTTRCK